MADSPLLRFNPKFITAIIPGEGLFLLGEHGHHFLKDAAYTDIAALLETGPSTRDRLAEVLVAECGSTFHDAYFRIHSMLHNGYLVEWDDLPDDTSSAAAFWHTLTPGLTDQHLLTQQTCIRLELLTEAGPNLRGSVEAAGLDVRPDADLSLVLVSDYLQPDLALVNAQALRSRRPWLLARPRGSVLWIGPVFVPGETPCWECMAHRLRANRVIENLANAQAGPLPPVGSQICAPVSGSLAIALAAIQLKRWAHQRAAGGKPGACELTCLDIAAMSLTSHTVLRRPQCRSCHDGGVGTSGPIKIELSPRLKRIRDDGGYRTERAEEVVRRYGDLISPLVGVVPVLRRQDLGIDQLHVYISGPNVATQFNTIDEMRSGFRSVNAGKGASDAQARASAIAEALERHSGIFSGDERCTLGTKNRLGDCAIPPNDCMLFSRSQFESRAEWNSRKLRFHRVPVSFDPDAVIDWSPVWSLTHEAVKYLPTSYLYYGYPRTSATDFCWADSNGNAAGSNLEEAVLQGFLELVERDGVAIWWYNRLRVPPVDLDSVDDPYVQQLRRIYEELHRPVHVLDLTADLGIPVLAAVSGRVDKAAQDILVAFGAHLDGRVALRRALTELNQFLPAVHGASTDAPGGGYAFDDPESLYWWKTATFENQPYLLPSAHSGPRSIASMCVETGDNLYDDIAACRRIVEERGMEVMVCDMTRPDIGLPVVKVIVPGLRHFWARYAPGRLYDVPIELGWRDSATAEEDLNPIPLFL